MVQEGLLACCLPAQIPTKTLNQDLVFGRQHIIVRFSLVTVLFARLMSNVSFIGEFSVEFNMLRFQFLLVVCRENFP